MKSFEVLTEGAIREFICEYELDLGRIEWSSTSATISKRKTKTETEIEVVCYSRVWTQIN